MKTTQKFTFLLANILLLTIFPPAVFAQEGGFQPACEFLGGCEEEIGNLGTPETNLETADELARRIARVFTISYGLVAAILVGVILWGVLKITTSGSNSDQKAEGFKILQNGIVGFFASFVLVIIFFYLFVYLKLVNFSDIPAVIFGED